ncbi:copper/silver efflux system membrane fusion protein CusB [Citrobacter koseri]|nr:copper/silver efflux system membrane fusion protein CusB [Citrobacter koseri]
MPAWPDKRFTISKWAILPSVDATTRTLQLRLQVDNPDEALKPGMNAYLKLKTQSEPMLLIPSKALIDNGTEQRVIAVDNDGRFVPKQVSVFHESQGVTAIRAGLAEGEKVVSSGLFLIDSEANISGALDRMRAQSAAPDHAAHSH